MHIHKLHETMKKISLSILILLSGFGMFAQESTRSILRLSYSVLDVPRNFDPPGNYPSMIQSTELSGDLYDLGFWGIDALGNAIIRNRQQRPVWEITRTGFSYLAGLGFAYYGSELPIPLGVFAHEEFHRSVLGASGFSSLNGNWILNRWDGTVYGLTDEDLSALKSDHLEGLLYSYVSGVQSENYLTQVNVMMDFYHPRRFYKGPLYLYNAYYTWNYFRFSTSPASDSVKVLAPPHEDPDPFFRDYAGADLTAWIYDMFSPDKAYTDRVLFPDGEGVNRRIGFSELTPEGQKYLNRQKNLALLNFINPAIFLINRIRFSDQFMLTFFIQYNPTHFGNDIALYLPVTIGSGNHLLAVHNYNNREKSFWGIQYGRYNIPLSAHVPVMLGGTASVWMQPSNQDFNDPDGKWGGAVEVNGSYTFARGISAEISAGYKTAGWMIGNPYLDQKSNVRLAVRYILAEK